MIELLSEDIWHQLKKTAKGCRAAAFVAVAYFGMNGSKMLPLRKRSKLIVDASERAVKSGQTCPEQLKQLFLKGVRVYSMENLHAKIFVFGSKAFIGSANVSRNSSETLKEAVIKTSNRAVVSAARNLVREWCSYGKGLGLEELGRLQRMYKPPLMFGKRKTSRKAKKSRLMPKFSPLRLVNLTRPYFPEDLEPIFESVESEANKLMDQPESHMVDSFYWCGSCSIRPGEQVILIDHEGKRKKMVRPPGTVINTKPLSIGKTRYTVIGLERPKGNRVSFEILAKRIGYGAKKRLSRGGPVNRDFAQKLLAAFNI